jgi:hypothetical protein
MTLLGMVTEKKTEGWREALLVKSTKRLVNRERDTVNVSAEVQHTDRSMQLEIRQTL